MRISYFHVFTVHQCTQILCIALDNVPVDLYGIVDAFLFQETSKLISAFLMRGSGAEMTLAIPVRQGIPAGPGQLLAVAVIPVAANFAHISP